MYIHSADFLKDKFILNLNANLKWNIQFALFLVPTVDKEVTSVSCLISSCKLLKSSTSIKV